ncbi:MAG: OpcA/G6PD domain-containing protein, partial [Propionibacteriaceae bacterium]
RLTTAAGDIALTRPDGLLASYAVPGQPNRLVALKRRETHELLSEELRRMDADDILAHSLRALQRRRRKARDAKRGTTKKAVATEAAAKRTTRKRASSENG